MRTGHTIGKDVVQAYKPDSGNRQSVMWLA